MDDDLTHDPEFKAWAAHVHAHVMPMIKDSAATVQLVPTGETDVKFAVELGLSIMLDKPIIAIVQPGMTVPEHLRRVADRVIEVDLSSPDAKGMVIEALRTVEALRGVTPPGM